MVWRNRRSYGLLSVTVVLTFSFLLGYLLYTDTQLYNFHKEHLRTDRNVIIAAASPPAQGQMADPRMDVLLRQAQNLTQVDHYTFWRVNYIGTGSYWDGEAFRAYSPFCLFIPATVWQLYDVSWSEPIPLDIRWLDGEEHSLVHLDRRQMLMDSQLFYQLGLDQQETPVYSLKLQSLNRQQTLFIELEVVGIFESEYARALRMDLAAPEAPRIGAVMYLPMALLNDIPDSLRQTWRFEQLMVLYSPQPETVGPLAENLGVGNFAYTYKVQNWAQEDKQAAQTTKATVTAALFVILGISLYACFSNALNDRKFEIGVKRALGAPGRQIIGQFLTEGLLVMGFDCLLSIALVTDLAIAVKYLCSQFPVLDSHFNGCILYISPQSVGMFAACTVGLALSFSLVFAYKTTQVQIVDYLKAE